MTRRRSPRDMGLPRRFGARRMSRPGRRRAPAVRPVGRRRLVVRVAGPAAAAALVVLLAVAPPVRAGTYTIDSCANGSAAGWSHFNYGAWATGSNGGGLSGGGRGAATWGVAGRAAGRAVR